MGLKINYLAQLSPFAYSGGGEVIAKRLIETGRQRGHCFALTTSYPRQSEKFYDADLAILVDLFNCPFSLRRLPLDLLAEMERSTPFVHLSNAYVDVCNLDYLPCSGNSASSCNYKERLSTFRRFLLRDFSTNCFLNRPIIKALYERARLNVFLSPLHQRIIYNMLNIGGVDYFILKPLIDETVFFDRGGDRDLEYLFVGVIGEAKGLKEMRQRFHNSDIHFIGMVAKGAKLDFGHHHGFVPYDQVPHYMNRARNFVFLPRWPEPQGRVVVEAAMCGCNLITNDNVGATSFDFDIRKPENFRNADIEFWEKIESLV